VIVRLPNGQYVLYTSDGTRRLSKPGTLDEVKRRERQVQFFKHLGARKKSAR
jgi:hypothetical protein